MILVGGGISIFFTTRTSGSEGVDEMSILLGVMDANAEQCCILSAVKHAVASTFLRRCLHSTHYMYARRVDKNYVIREDELFFV